MQFSWFSGFFFFFKNSKFGILTLLLSKIHCFFEIGKQNFWNLEAMFYITDLFCFLIWGAKIFKFAKMNNKFERKTRRKKKRLWHTSWKNEETSIINLSICECLQWKWESTNRNFFVFPKNKRTSFQNCKMLNVGITQFVSKWFENLLISFFRLFWSLHDKKNSLKFFHNSVFFFLEKNSK